MSESATSEHSSSAFARPNYKKWCLAPNNISFSFCNTQLTLTATQIRSVKEVSDLLDQLLDDSLAIPLKDQPIASGPAFKTQKNGHQDIELARTGHRLYDDVRALMYECKDHWKAFWSLEVWIPLKLTSLCDWSSVLISRMRISCS